MKNKSKYIFNGVLTITCLIVLLNFHKIKFTLNMIKIFSESSKYEEETKNSEDINDNVKNPLYSIIDSEKSVEGTEYNIDAVDNQYGSIENNRTNIDSLKQNKVERKSLSSIADKYNGKLVSIQVEFLDKLNILIDSAYREYKSGQIPTAKLASKYITEGSNLEKECDKKVYAIIDEMEKELIANDHDTLLAAEVKSYYRASKEREKEKLFSKVASKL